MTQEKLTVLAVCASGVIVSSMLARKIKESLVDLGAEVSVIHLLPSSVESFVAEVDVDFIVTTGPIPGEIPVPIINGLSLLSDFDQETVREEIRQMGRDVLGRE